MTITQVHTTIQHAEIIAEVDFSDGNRVHIRVYDDGYQLHWRYIYKWEITGDVYTQAIDRYLRG